MAMQPGLGTLLLLGTGVALAQGESPNPSFYLVNRSQVAISRVYATPAGMPNWGLDRLTGPVAPGFNVAIRLPADGNCIYDLRIVYVGGRSEERRGLNVCEADNVSFPDGRTNTGPMGAGRNAARSAANPSFLLVNRGRSTLNELYLSPAGDDSWGQDRLGDDTVRAGTSRTIRVASGDCLYDLRAVFANGEANERRRVNLCDLIELRVP